MITLDIPETGTRMYMPSDLSECDSRQYNEISFLIYELQNGKIPYDVFRIRAVYVLLNLKLVDADTSAHQETKMSNIYQISELVDSFFEKGEGEDDGANILKQYYVHNPIKKVRPMLLPYYGPKDGFSNMQFGEYIDALHFFSEYHQTKEIVYLYHLMAVVYRKSKHLYAFTEDCRVQHNPSTVERRSKKFEKLFFGEVYGFFLLFASFQKYLITAKIYWQGRELDLSILFNTDDAEKSDIPGLGMKSTLYALAESGVFGTKRELEKENLWEVLMRMYDLTKRDLDHKAKEDAEKTKK